MFSTITGIKFKSKNEEELKEEVYAKLGVERDSIYIHNEYVGFLNKCKREEEDALDYKRGLIVKRTPPPHSNIYRHLLCEEESEHVEKEEVNIKELVASLGNASEEQKQLVCDNLESVIKEIFTGNITNLQN